MHDIDGRKKKERKEKKKKEKKRKKKKKNWQRGPRMLTTSKGALKRPETEDSAASK